MADKLTMKKLSLVVASPYFEKVHYAFVMATGATAIGVPVTMFFTMGACPAILKNPDWRTLPSEKPDTTATARDQAFTANGVAGMDELIDSAAELGIVFMICEMGLRAEALEEAPLRSGLKAEHTGVVTFFHDAGLTGPADGSHIIYI